MRLIRSWQNDSLTGLLLRRHNALRWNLTSGSRPSRRLDFRSSAASGVDMRLRTQPDGVMVFFYYRIPLECISCLSAV